MRKTTAPRMTIALLVAFAAVHAIADEPAPNSLSNDEVKLGWKLLFDGKDTSQWKSYGKPDFPSKGWEVEDGWLIKKAGVRPGNIVTREQFTDFEFSWEWRIAEGGNNGVKYFVDESRGELGHEYQMLGEKGRKLGKGSTAGFYAVLAPGKLPAIKIAPEFNRSRIRVLGDKVQHWLNGELVLEYECGSEEVLAGVATSKFKAVKDFGRKLTARIMLTDHGSECAFRSLKIRKLPSK